MSSIPQKCELSNRPGWQFLHVHQLPDLYCGGIDFPDQSQEGWVKILVDLGDLVYITLLIPFYSWSVT